MVSPPGSPGTTYLPVLLAAHRPAQDTLLPVNHPGPPVWELHLTSLVAIGPPATPQGLPPGLVDHATQRSLDTPTTFYLMSRHPECASAPCQHNAPVRPKQW